ncbi:acyltransferase family protein [Marinicella litoralis]|uniref:Peptidoglycan/LPS O-acetylase OafA/YrhL n=1 Tax=Marinicella litoralis TaxID=644220 RepID=A0A4R6XDT0_9GAMM|nr:acyltransferase [Marinicella litoralis]TDR16319.1 peptidoglycan/LPS O-acetylase OafA/YrhL [Marinicella litoralis]
MINNIQILRGLAALWVFLHHSLGHFKAMGFSFLPFEWLASYGYIGVDVFFVISGLVMAKTTEKHDSGWHSGQLFLGKRFFRIYLGYWPVFILTYVVYWYFQDENLSKIDLIGSIFLLNANMFELLIGPAWSLPFELYFYLLIALLIFFSVKRPHVFFLIISALIVIKLNVMDFGVSALIDLVLSHMIFEFIMGYYLWHYRHYFLKVNFLIYLIVGAACFMIGSYYDLVNTVWRPVTLGLFSWAVVALALIFEGKLKPIVVRMFKPIGDASYTLYLLHSVLLYSFYHTGVRTWFVDQQWPLAGFTALILIVVLLSYLFYLMVEKPLYHFAVNRFIHDNRNDNSKLNTNHKKI